jgi:hypothetical protein
MGRCRFCKMRYLTWSTKKERENCPIDRVNNGAVGGLGKCSKRRCTMAQDPHRHKNAMKNPKDAWIEIRFGIISAAAPFAR